MTGGGKDQTPEEKTVEVFVPGTNISCILPPLPEKTSSHTQDGLIQCGGYGSLESCHQFTEGNWTESHSLSEKRVRHSSWRTGERSLLLLGGRESLDTTERITEGSETTANTIEPFQLGPRLRLGWRRD